MRCEGGEGGQQDVEVAGGTGMQKCWLEQGKTLLIKVNCCHIAM